MAVALVRVVGVVAVADGHVTAALPVDMRMIVVGVVAVVGNSGHG